MTKAQISALIEIVKYCKEDFEFVAGFSSEDPDVIAFGNMILIAEKALRQQGQEEIWDDV